MAAWKKQMVFALLCAPDMYYRAWEFPTEQFNNCVNHSLRLSFGGTKSDPIWSSRGEECGWGIEHHCKAHLNKVSCCR